MKPRKLLNLVLSLVLAGLVLLVIYEPGKETPQSVTRLTGLEPAQVTDIVIEQPQQASIILNRDGNGWLMQQPLSVSAHREIIEQILGLATATSHSQYDASEADLALFKLNNPDLTITLNDTRLSFGTTDALQGFRYVLINERVHLITDRYTHMVRNKSTALISPSLFPDTTLFSRLVLPGLTLQKGEHGWSTRPENHFHSADQVQSLLDEWRYARALQVRMVTEESQQEMDTASVSPSHIEIETGSGALTRFKLISNDDEVILVRPDLGLQYFFNRQTGDRLLGLTGSQSKADTDL